MLTRRGRAVLAGGVVTYGFGMLTGYDQLLVLGAGALATVVLGGLWVLRRHGLDVDRHVAPDRVTRGQRGSDGGSPVRAHLSVRNRRRGPSPVALAVELVNGEPRPVAVLRLPGHERRDLTYTLPNDRRGVFDVGPVEITRSDPLSLWRTVQRAGAVHRLWVHPRQHALTLRAGQAPSLEGEAGDQAFDGSVTFHALREYVPGDDLRLVHWRTYARTGELLVRENVDTGVAQMTILVDTRRMVHDAPSGDGRDTGNGAGPAGGDPDDLAVPGTEHLEGFEAAMEAAASMAVAAAHAGYAARLVTTCGKATAAQVGRAPTAILDLLAALTPSSSRSLPERSPALAAGGTNDVLLAITGLAPPDDLTALGAVTRQFRRSSIVVVGPTAHQHPVPPVLAGKVLRATSGEDFARAWNVGAGAA
ncbi:MAG TPA: DUF58 domain-containing protein [Acidimicrobiales bacterium]